MELLPGNPGLCKSDEPVRGIPLALFHLPACPVVANSPVPGSDAGQPTGATHTVKIIAGAV